MIILSKAVDFMILVILSKKSLRYNFVQIILVKINVINIILNWSGLCYNDFFKQRTLCFRNFIRRIEFCEMI